MSIGLALILITTLAATPPACTWAHPGANPYRGDPLRVLDDFDLPPDTRDKLRELMRAHRPTDTATITRDDIVGSDGAYADLREMHSGHGRVCHGLVDRTAWSAKRRERALVYCAGDACVIVPAICHNVSLVSRKPARVADNDGPIDIEPAAGPPRSTEPSTTPSPDDGPLGFMPAPDGGGGLPGIPGAPVGGGNGGNGGMPPEGGPVAGEPPLGGPPGDAPPIGGGGGDEGGWPPVGSPPSDSPPFGGPPGGLFPCCDTPPGIPIGPGSPGSPPVIAPVPESPAWMLLLTGLAALRPWRLRTGKRR